MNHSHLLEVVRVRELARDGKTRDARLRAGLSLSEVGITIGVSSATVYRWERGQRRPTGAAALRYARLCESLMDHESAGQDAPQA